MAGNEDAPGAVEQDGPWIILAAEADDVVAGAVERRVEGAIAVETRDRKVGVAAVGGRIPGDHDASGGIDGGIGHPADSGDV